jgi:hypothetical protein
VLLGIGCLSYETIEVEGSVPHRRRTRGSCSTGSARSISFRRRPQC